MKKGKVFNITLLIVWGIALHPTISLAYSVLAHQALIDQSWEKSIKPLLKLKYPGCTEEQLKQAHAYAYGGAIAPDMGYFPFGSILFTDLVHYVRSGDFVNALLDEADSLNEYAFAIGFLCHYEADQYGHPLGTNVCVPLIYPKMKRKFGDIVTYAENPISHKRTEFSFDVLQTAKGNYASQSYHDFIGFEVSRPVLERAFVRIYGLNLTDVSGDFSLATGFFRLSVKNLFPLLTRAGWVNRKTEIEKINPSLTNRSFRYRMRKSEYHAFDKEGKKPGLFANVLAFIIMIAPKIGPLQALKFKEPGPKGEKLFMASFDSSLNHFTATVYILRSGDVDLENVDYDTGKNTCEGEYSMADKDYRILLMRLQKDHFAHLTKGLEKNIFDFYAGQTTTTNDNTKSSKQRRQVAVCLEQMKKAPVN